MSDNDKSNVSHVFFDYNRTARVGLPEAVFCQGKETDTLRSLVREFHFNKTPILFTRLKPEVYALFTDEEKSYIDYCPLSATAYTSVLPKKDKGKVAIVTAGTADASVAYEAARTLSYLGVRHTVFEDCGVAGLWRLTTKLDAINQHDIIIIVAGLDAALASVLGGLTSKPLYAVPTSVGYGIAEKGNVALGSMLTSCAPGVAVMNIDNGYGAACAAMRLINSFLN